ncbi:hypothetical protein O6P43_024113 [Quillaja saponaria]|uniref:Uncharacterized protein n=1 Tax=Quillaja saponaria TaxID=32244 RepID=A0AAD7PES5_QUISA|nr:hypothetical protein O6P43_024113 [Quillaja saponaria]
MRKHCASTRKSETVTLNLNPVMNSLLNTEFSMGNIVIPCIILAPGPLEGVLYFGGVGIRQNRSSSFVGQCRSLYFNMFRSNFLPLNGSCQGVYSL